MYFAKLDGNNVVLQVIVAEQSFVDSQPGRFVRTDINGISPKNYAGIGHTYRQDLNGFVPPKPYNSWVLNAETCLWDAPVSKPEDDNYYVWDEDTVNWINVPLPVRG